MIETVVSKIIKIDIGQIVEIGEYLSVPEYNKDRIIETDQDIIRTTEVALEEDILEYISDQIIIIEVKIIQVDIEEIIEMIIMKEVEVGPRIDNIPIISGRMIEVTVGVDQIQELAQIEIEVDTINVEKVIILLRIVQPLK